MGRVLFNPRKAGAPARFLEGYLTRMLAAIRVKLEWISERRRVLTAAYLRVK